MTITLLDSNQMGIRDAVFVYQVLGKAAVSQDIRQKIIAQSYMDRLMGICTDGDQLSAQFAVALKDNRAGIGLLHMTTESAGIDFQCNIFADDVRWHR